MSTVSHKQSFERRHDHGNRAAFTPGEPAGPHEVTVLVSAWAEGAVSRATGSGRLVREQGP